MIRLIAAIILFPAFVYAGSVQCDGKKITYCDIYSLKDFTNQNLLDRKDLKNKTIYGSCFSQEIPETKIFPSGMKGVTFINCNLDNVFIPSGNTVIGGSQRQFKAMDDGQDYLVNEQGEAISPLND